MSYKVLAKRHLAKTISYRIVSTALGFGLMWWATGDIKFGAAFGVAELVIKPVLYYLHERFWYNYLKFGLVEEKKPKTKKVQSDENDSQVKEPKNQTKSSGKKVLNYSANR